MGTYPAPPAARMAYDRDGTILVRISEVNEITQLSAGDVTILSNESETNWSNGFTGATNGYLVAVFPQLRNIAGYFWVEDNSPGGTQGVWTSPDTTNGLDGTWTSLLTGAPASGPVKPTYRTGILLGSRSNIKAVRFATGVGSGGTARLVKALHLYGSIATGQSPNRLKLIDPVAATELPVGYFDFGEALRGSVNVKTFRVLNDSPTLTATGIALAMDFPTDASPALAAQFGFSSDGVAYNSTLSLADRGPGLITPVCYLRYSPSGTAQLGLWSPRVLANVSSMA